MKRIFQTSVHKNLGDCQRAAIASLFDLDNVEMVPHFKLYSDNWWKVMYNFCRGLGYNHMGCEYVKRLRLYKKYSVGGYYYAAVKSRTFKGATHAVIINRKGVVVHDPNPNKMFLGVNVVKSKELEYVYKFHKRTDKYL